MISSYLLKRNTGQLFGKLFGLRLILAFSLRRNKNMSFFYGDTRDTLANRKEFLDSLGIDYRALVCAKQVHSSSVRYVKEELRGSGAENYESALGNTDAMTTDQKSIPLAIFTADCLSVFLFDPVNNAIGIVHAGRRGTKEKILEKTIAAMRERFNSQPKDIYAVFGPAIRKCCYEVAEDLSGIFPGYLSEKNGKLYLDLTGINKNQLEKTGLSQKNIFDSGICTFCNPLEYFSYRREKESCGRMMSVIMLK
jgi:YfiH family protein